MNDLRLMRDDIYYGYCIAMLYKTWPFKSSFDIHVLHVVESGIQRYWELQVCENSPSLTTKYRTPVSKQTRA